MACRAFEDLIIDYVDEHLSAAECRSLEAHVATCPACQRFRQHQMELDRALAVVLPRLAVSPAFQPAVLARTKLVPHPSLPQDREALAQKLEAEHRVRLGRLRRHFWDRDVPRMLDRLGIAAALLAAGFGLIQVLGARLGGALQERIGDPAQLSILLAWGLAAGALAAGFWAAFGRRSQPSLYDGAFARLRSLRLS